MSGKKPVFQPESAVDAVADIFTGATVSVGGFGPMDNRPLTLVTALAQRPEVKELTIVSNGFPHQPLAEQHMVKKLIGAFGGSVYRVQAASEDQIRSGELEFEPSPQGIMTERLRAGGAGIAGFFSPVGVDTLVAKGKERRTIDGRDYIYETGIRPDFGFIRAEKADEAGNLSGVGSTLNFHPSVAAASKITIAEVDEVVPVGAIKPEDVTIPGIFVDRIVLRDQVLAAKVKSETPASRPRRQVDTSGRVGISQDQMAERAARMLPPGAYVNLGMGIPVKVSNYITKESGVMLHSENGLLGYGPTPTEDEYKWYFYNAQGQPVVALPGASVFDSLWSFTMARGGHLDAVILGGLQVSAKGDLANWWAPHMAAGGMGGAMDLCTDVPELIVLMEHTTREGDKRILNECAYPLTGAHCVTKIITELAYIEVTPEGLVLRELAPGVTAEYVQERTEPTLIIPDDIKEMQVLELATA